MATTETRLRVVTSEDVQRAQELDALTGQQIVEKAIDTEIQLAALIKLVARLRARALLGDRTARDLLMLAREEIYSLHAECLSELGSER